ncbi:MAG: Ldh family oxidoreductase [Candidatus Hodarchaeota archaeon]
MKKNRDHYNVDDLFTFAVEVLKSKGYSEKSAEATAYALLEADKRGIFSHGIAGGTGLEEAVRRTGTTATVIPDAEPIILKQKYPSILVIDANGAPGHIVSMIATNQVKGIARKQGLAKVFVNNANHFGAAGVWSSKIAEDYDLVGVVTCTTAACVRPMGDDPKGLDYTRGAGKEVRTGTNPLAISVPYEGGILTLDMALTRMAISYCIKALKAGEMLEIPEYIADKNYKSTLNPRDLFGAKGVKGSLFPLGSTLSGYKGDAQLRMIEVTHSLGGGPIRRVSEEGTGVKRRISLVFEAQAIDFLYTKKEARKRVKDLMTDYENYFGSASRWPGDRSNKALEYALKEGVPYSQGQIETLRRIATYVGLDFDKMVQSLGKKPYPVEIFNK